MLGLPSRGNGTPHAASRPDTASKQRIAHKSQHAQNARRIQHEVEGLWNPIRLEARPRDKAPPASPIIPRFEVPISVPSPGDRKCDAF